MFGAAPALTALLLPVTTFRSSASGCKCGSGGFEVVPAFAVLADSVAVAEVTSAS
jgi:hypothetical protein